MNLPLASCLMLTKDRRRYVERAIRCLQSQTYQNLEFVVVDNGVDHVEDLIPVDDRRWRYSKVEPETMNLHQLRNLSVKLARGEFCLIFDNDDWHAPSRAAYQVAAMLTSPEVDVAAVGPRMLFELERTGDVFSFDLPPPTLLHDTTAVFRRATWTDLPESGDIGALLNLWPQWKWLQLKGLFEVLFTIHRGVDGNVSKPPMWHPAWQRVVGVTGEMIRSGWRGDLVLEQIPDDLGEFYL